MPADGPPHGRSLRLCLTTATPEPTAKPLVVNQLDAEVETNLSRKEQLSLAAAIIASPDPVTISSLPLAERAGEQTLRQIKPDASRPLWPQL